MADPKALEAARRIVENCDKTGPYVPLGDLIDDGVTVARAYLAAQAEALEEAATLFERRADVHAKALIKQAGAASADRLTHGVTGDSWTMIACIDRLVELGELVELPNPVSSWAQHRVFIDGKEQP